MMGADYQESEISVSPRFGTLSKLCLLPWSDYNVGETTQVPIGRMIAIRGRVNRKIGYGGAYVSYEPAPKV
jgi:hypothetical protein